MCGDTTTEEFDNCFCSQYCLNSWAEYYKYQIKEHLRKWIYDDGVEITASDYIRLKKARVCVMCNFSAATEEFGNYFCSQSCLNRWAERFKYQIKEHLGKWIYDDGVEITASDYFWLDKAQGWAASDRASERAKEGWGNPARELSDRISASMRHALKKGVDGLKWESLVGYTRKDLFLHLDKTMPRGCSWADFDSGYLHIDHMTPIAQFSFASPNDPDFKDCWALDNLQLLRAEDNIDKGDGSGRAPWKD